MVQGASELMGMCLGIVGLLGAAVTTGLPMWKVTAFIGENIIVMETRWEGLWMNCYRQSNIRMQCKVYDSLLFLPPELQAARGLMCCSLALSGIGLLVALVGLRSLHCLSGQLRLKRILLMVAGGMQVLASACVFIPVSWTGHAIIRDFYNPLLIDAQRRELGEALYIGWVSGAVLFAAGLVFLCCWRIVKEEGSFDVYQPGYYYAPGAKPTLTRFHPLASSMSSAMQQQPMLMHQTSFLAPPSSVHSMPPMAPQGPYPFNPQQTIQYGQQQFVPAAAAAPMVYPAANAMPLYPPPAASFTKGGPQHQLTPRESLYYSQSQHSTPYTATSQTPYASYQSNSSFHPVQQKPVFIGYDYSRVAPSHSSSSSGMRI
ncbi:claudin-8-like [Engraulis encrasicolus]|uniref:claudin-8-like n=1 Tax=Engraulis encrasicolus TaxID=184585 RepID=UPI002FCFF537